jgi:hypothetical protein
MMKKGVAIGISFLCLVFGAVIYITLRDTSSSLTSHLLHILPIQFVSALTHFMRSLNLPCWLVDSLPDALWMFAFCLLILVVWDFKLNKNGKFWIIVALLVGILFEVLQVAQLTPGTFDWMDLFLITIAPLLSLLFTIELRSYEKPA